MDHRATKQHVSKESSNKEDNSHFSSSTETTGKIPACTEHYRPPVKNDRVNRRREIQIFRNLVLGDPDLAIPLDDEFLLKFLRSRKFDPDRALHLLQKYYRLRVDNPVLFQDFLPSAMKEVFSDNIQGILPHRAPSGAAIFVFKTSSWNTSKFHADDIFRANLMCLEKAIVDEATQKHGIAAIMDLEGFSFSHFRQMTPNHTRRIIALVQDCFPARFRDIHVVNEPTLFGVLFNLLKPFLNEKLKNRIFTHGNDFMSLHQYIPSDILPSEYGGRLEPFNNENWHLELQNSEDMFIKNNRYGYKGFVSLE